ncbi:PREDICTED: uncharacterized protein LOC105558746 [Vollenhovia emeryi]|uniref:uncharacterized protein LOC105558746 n=1 Tax=Vollenhovia emeryi TaxID=411798 RepID=UPI0005F4990E|nr:PREDICTED: uncharacterized protein LOC105558746 [Vollenhovia emeryi]
MRERYRERMGEVRVEEGEVEEEIEQMNKRIKEEMIKEEEGGRGEGERREGWWDEECKELKRKAKEELRRWRKGITGKEMYSNEKREFRRVCDEKKRKENERWERWAMEERSEPEISREEIRNVVRNLKNNKATGEDEIPNEAWKYGGEKIEEWIEKMCNRIWRGEGWPEGWKEGIIVPIIKKREGRVVKEYRGVTLLPTLYSYKIYASVLAGRLRQEMEEKEAIPQNQAGFRKGMGAMDNVYALNYLVNRQTNRKRGKLVVLFLDLKAAFDSVDRGILIKAMRERGIREGLISRCEEILAETKSRVRVGEEAGGIFWTGRGVRQGCPLSAIMFNLIMADMEEVLKKGRWGGVKLGEEKIYTLGYADNVAVLAEEQKGMRAMMARLERYMDRKGMEEEHVKERIKQGMAVMGQVWGIGKRRFGREWEKKIWLYDSLVWSVIGYGVEVWGWEERESMERCQEKYLRWVLGVDRRTPGYMVREEVQREKLRERAGLRRAWEWERRLEEGKGSEIARRCLEEIKRRAEGGKELSRWERGRIEFFERRGWEIKEVRRRREKGETMVEELIKAGRDLGKQERWEKIRNSKYNEWYKYIKTEQIPIYLKKGWGDSRWRRIARSRLGNEVRGGSIG